MWSQILKKAFPFLFCQGHTFKCVITNPVVKLHRLLIEHEQSAIERRNCHSCLCMGMQNTVGIRRFKVDGAMNNKSRRVHSCPSRMHHLAAQVHTNQIAGCDIAEHHTKRIDQETIGRIRHAQRDMGIDKVVHSKMLHKPITGGKINTGLPFCSADFAFGNFRYAHDTQVNPFFSILTSIMRVAQSAIMTPPNAPRLH